MRSNAMSGLCAIVLVQLACGADVMETTQNSKGEAEQCLMQKKHEVSKADVKPHVNQGSRPEDEVRSVEHTSHEHRGSVGGLGEESLIKQSKMAKVLSNQASHATEGKASTTASKTRSTSMDLEELLPGPVLDLGLALFKTKDALKAVVNNSVLINLTFSGVNMSLRMNQDDDAVRRLSEEGTFMSYDLDKLDDAPDHVNTAAGSVDRVDSKHTTVASDKMLNVIDVGGNYGVVTIAIMKKYKKRVRVATVEPMPTTFFFLTWNMYINNVPLLAALEEKDHDSGVWLLNRGCTDVESEDLHFCTTPESSMNAKICDCKISEDNCIAIPSVTVDDLVGTFGSEPIDLVKMDCEGCEFKSLPALAAPRIQKRVRRLAGELHIPDEKIESLACLWDHGRLVQKCQMSTKEDKDKYPVECDVALACPE